MNYKKINNITGWAICLIACSVYLMTMEASGSLWDCGEFASSAYKIQNPHPPGAPLFVLIGRLFMIPFSPQNAVRGLNAMSAIASGFTILFLFWNITHFGRKIALRKTQELNMSQIIGIMAAGVVGALAYTFSDSFWYSAVEGEVYALSSFFTAVVFWAILKWEQAVTEEQAAGITGHFTKADRWLVLIFYLMGLSIGVHLLNLLTLPAIVLVYYFKRYKATLKGSIIAFFIGIVITGFVQKAVIQWSIKWAGNMDIYFVNDMGMPFFSGFAFFFILLAALLYYLIKMANKNSWNYIKLGAWSFAFMIVGYLTYLTPMVRSSANPSIDMFNVDNPVALFGYVGREQYGDWPILYGQYFTDEIKRDEQDNYVLNDDGKMYAKSDNNYVEIGDKKTPVYDDGHFFPRMWDNGNDKGQSDFYAKWTGIEKVPVTDPDGRRREIWSRDPTFGENVSYFFGYQLNWMYFRYFMWNFAGKQNDISSSDPGNVRDGNWISGINFLDKIRLGDQNMMPDNMKNNKANNKLFMLPLILGIAGLVYQWQRAKKDAVISIMLFFFTGIAIILYLNQTANQPRERDYAFVGSFYAFAIWIGLGVLMMIELLEKYIKKPFVSAALAGSVCFIAVPGNMAFQEWDDHDRSHKTIARDLAKDYLDGCPKNAILITFGDNDTYPLWYAQEVEGYRTDVRVINSSLLGADWNINQLRYKVNESDPINLVWTAEQILGSKRDQISLNPYSKTQDNVMELYTLLKDYAGNDNYLIQGINTYPTCNVSVNVKAQNVYKWKWFEQNDVISKNENLLPSIQFKIPDRIVKNDAAILNIIAANDWERPICFTSPYNSLGFGNYLRQNGMTYMLTPSTGSGPDNFNTQEAFINKMLNQFGSGNADKKGVYFDEENRRHLLSIRSTFASAAIALTEKNNATKSDTLTAQKLLEKCDKLMNEETLPYGMMSNDQRHNMTGMQYYIAAVKAKSSALIQKTSTSLIKDYNQQKAYYQSLNASMQESFKQNEIPNLINVFINSIDGNKLSSWELVSAANLSDSMMNYFQKNEAMYEAETGGFPMPFIQIINQKITGFTGASRFESTFSYPDFDMISINTTVPRTQQNPNGFAIQNVNPAIQQDIIFNAIRIANGYKFENQLQTLILTSNGKELIRFKRKL